MLAGNVASQQPPRITNSAVPRSRPLLAAGGDANQCRAWRAEHQVVVEGAVSRQADEATDVLAFLDAHLAP